MDLKKKIKIKQGETIENLEMAELTDEALDAVNGGATQTDTITCQCDECGAMLCGENEVMNHYLATNHCSYHYTG